MSSSTQNQQTITPLIIKFESGSSPTSSSATYQLTLQQGIQSTAAVPLTLPYSADTSHSVQEMLEQASLLEDATARQRQLQIVGQTMNGTLLADEAVAEFFANALDAAQSQRQPCSAMKSVSYWPIPPSLCCGFQRANCRPR